MILGRLGSAEDAAAYERSFGLCQPHLRRAVTMAPLAEVVRTLLGIQRRQLGLLVESLRANESDRSLRSQAARALALKLAGSVR